MAKVTDKDMRQWGEEVMRFAATHPDYNEVLEAAVKRGLYLSQAFVSEMVRLKSPETVYYLAKHDAESRTVFNSKDGEYVNPELAADKVRRLNSRIARNQTFQTAGQVQGEQREMSEYLEKRREDFRSGKRRRR